MYKYTHQRKQCSHDANRRLSRIKNQRNGNKNWLHWSACVSKYTHKCKLSSYDANRSLYRIKNQRNGNEH